MLHIRNKRDFWAGTFFVATGIMFALLSLQYALGTASRMGPGWFPAMVGVFLASMGAITLIGSVRTTADKAEIETIGWRELGLVLGSVALFAALLPHAGLVVSTSLLILVSAWASHEARLRETLAVIAVLLVLSWLVFVKGLGLQLPVWPAFVAGGG